MRIQTSQVWQCSASLAFTTSLVLLSFSLSGCSREASQGAAPPRATPVKIAVVGSKPISDTSTFVGTLKCRKSVTIRPRVSGYLTQIYVRSGDIVKAGTLLLEVDPAKEQEVLNTQLASLESNKAEKTSAEEKLRSLKADRTAKVANFEFARSQHARYLGLSKEGAVAQESVDQYSNQLKAAEADLNSIDAQIRAQDAVINKSGQLLQQSDSMTKQERLQLAYHRVLSPFAGVVGDIPVKLGQYVEPSTDLTTVDQSRPLEVYVYVPAEQASRLRKGMSMNMIDSEGKSLGDCSIFFISPQVDDRNQSVLVKALFANDAENLRSNQQVTTKIVWETKNRLMVPTNSVTHISGQDFVFVAAEEKAGSGFYVAKQRPVELGDIYENSYVVRSGLTGSEQIVVSNVQNLYEGAALAAGK
ncbi:efflux RND transporter periplasmic adaptor subunit [soil metagenome]